MEKYDERLIKFCQDLIRIPSLAGKEKGVARHVRDEVRALGYDDVLIDEFGSVVGIIRNGDGPTIIFDGHLDTVGVEPISEWNYDPFGGWLEDGKIYGRGASDMKGSVAAIVYGLALLLDQRDQFRGTIIASLSTLEEVSEGIALAHIIDTYGCDMLVIGEASNNTLIRGQRGRAEIAITTFGVPTHSSTPHFGIDPVWRMMKLIQRMNDMPMHKHEFLGSGVQALTDIISSPYPAQSTVPAKCRATFDRRLLLDETEESVMAEVNEIIREESEADPKMRASAEIVATTYTAYTGKLYDIRKFLPAWKLPRNHKVVQAALEGLRAENISEDEPTYYRFCTNGSLPKNFTGIPTIGFGPGDENLAHRKDEFVEVDKLLTAGRGYAAIARALSKLE